MSNFVKRVCALSGDGSCSAGPGGKRRKGSGQWAVVSGQWSVVSGRWSVERRENRRGRAGEGQGNGGGTAGEKREGEGELQFRRPGCSKAARAVSAAALTWRVDKLEQQRTVGALVDDSGYSRATPVYRSHSITLASDPEEYPCAETPDSAEILIVQVVVGTDAAVTFETRQSSNCVRAPGNRSGCYFSYRSGSEADDKSCNPVDNELQDSENKKPVSIETDGLSDPAFAGVCCKSVTWQTTPSLAKPIGQEPRPAEPTLSR